MESSQPGIEFYTDGSCIGNPGPGSWGWICYENGKEISHGRGKSPMTTNNQMELQAATNAYQNILNHYESWNASICICTDSSYVYEGVTKYLPSWKKKGWRLANKKPLKNLEQWIALDKLLQLGVPVERKWVKGHADDIKNNQVDKMIRK